MPYDPNSRAKQRVRARMAATAQGTDPDDATDHSVAPPQPYEVSATHAAVVSYAAAEGVPVYKAAALVTGASDRNSRTYGSRAVAAARRAITLREAFEKRPGLRNKRLAQYLDKAVSRMDSEDLAERHYGLKSLTIVAKIKGELSTERASSPAAPPNINVLVQVLRELQHERIQDVSPPVSLTDESTVNGKG